jgi:hypothetical protein
MSKITHDFWLWFMAFLRHFQRYFSYIVAVSFIGASVPITTKVVSSNPVYGEVYSVTTLCDKLCQ